MDALAELHDATFTTLEIDWARGELRCQFKTHAGMVVVRGVGFSELAVPRRQPWGPSVSVNDVTTEPSERGVRLLIAIQSGDVIAAQVEALVVER